MGGKDEYVIIHGVRLNRLGRASAVERVEKALLSEGDKSALPLTVFTPNAEIIYRCTKDERLLSLINTGSLNVPDGAGVVWAAQVLGTPIPGRIPGIELAEDILSRCARYRLPVYLLGGKIGVAEQAAAGLALRFPGIVVTGTHHGYFDPRGSENDNIIERINAAAPSLLIVCLGFPRQEEWTSNNRSALPGVRVMMALGGSLDVWSGRVRRAPRIFRGARLEWLWRICRHPSRLGRAAALPAFVRLTVREGRKSKKIRKAEKNNR